MGTRRELRQASDSCVWQTVARQVHAEQSRGDRCCCCCCCCWRLLAVLLLAAGCPPTFIGKGGNGLHCIGAQDGSAQGCILAVRLHSTAGAGAGAADTYRHQLEHQGAVGSVCREWLDRQAGWTAEAKPGRAGQTVTAAGPSPELRLQQLCRVCHRQLESGSVQAARRHRQPAAGATCRAGQGSAVGGGRAQALPCHLQQLLPAAQWTHAKSMQASPACPTCL